MDYKQTLTLPKTAFPMKADLPKREPLFLQLWKENELYQQILAKRKGSKTFLLHDGPPFANGDAHMGTALNKALKDIVLKSHNMMGYYVPYLPGWDCHGLPIEHKVTQEMEKSGKLSREPAEIRTQCEAYAKKYVGIQSEQFQRLGVFGEWKEPYLTMNAGYEAEILRCIAKMVDQDLIYQGMRPVFWSSGCQTALAEAEVEYQDRRDTAVYTAFALTSASCEKLAVPQGTSFLIWTTTPWTLPSNLSIAYQPRLTYALVEGAHGLAIMAQGRVEAVGQILQQPLKVLKTFAGTELEGLQYTHPLLPREGTLYAGDFVTQDSGTGLVHIAPGHGYDDYIYGQQHGLAMLSPVDDEGKLTEECQVPEVTGMYVFDANAKIVELLRTKKSLWASEEYFHSYPHCWRSKTPIIFRCVKQWFIKVDAIRQKALDAIDKVKWVPDWGKNRIRGAVESRPDWCISRQRTWGVPLPVFYQQDGKPVLSADVIRKFADIVEKEGTNVWFSTEQSALAQRLGLEQDLVKGLDTLDVWIDSGCSHAAVMRKQLEFPASMYLEGSDQHRGWFQSSLLISVAVNDGEPPYREVVTNGFVVDVDGKKLSKSSSYQKPTSLMHFVETYGADILRLWVSSQDYRDDVPFSEEIFKRVTDTYRLFRNTFRVLLGNLSGFDPQAHRVPSEQWTELDVYVMHKLQGVITSVRKAYEAYEFHQVYHVLNRFCAVELSALYVDVTKDRMYCDGVTSTRRRATQTVMWDVLEALCKMLAPIMPYTTEETWQAMVSGGADVALHRESIHLQELPQLMDLPLKDNFEQRWEKLLQLRSLANEQLEKARQAKTIGKSLEASLEIQTPDFNASDAELLCELFIVSQVNCTPSEQTSVSLSPAKGKKCSRCWKHDEKVGENAEHPELCPRCAEVVSA